MKKLFAILTLFSLISLSTSAQKKDKTPETKKEKIKDELGLSTDVAAKVKAIKTDYKTKEKAIEADTKLDKKAMKAKKKVLKEERETKILALLTPEQKVKYKELKEKNKAEKDASDD